MALGGHLALRWGLAGSTLPARPPHSIRAPGRLINTIRVVCASYEDYSHWLLCLQTVCQEDRASPPLGPESLPGLRAPTQVRSQQGRCCWAMVKQTGGLLTATRSSRPHCSPPGGGRPLSPPRDGRGRGQEAGVGDPESSLPCPSPHQPSFLEVYTQ